MLNGTAKRFLAVEWMSFPFARVDACLKSTGSCLSAASYVLEIGQGGSNFWNALDIF